MLQTAMDTTVAIIQIDITVLFLGKKSHKSSLHLGWWTRLDGQLGIVTYKLCHLMRYGFLSFIMFYCSYQ
jgi:hypothetical protein